MRGINAGHGLTGSFCWMAGSVGTLALAEVAWAIAFKADPAPDWPDLAMKQRRQAMTNATTVHEHIIRRSHVVPVQEGSRRVL